MGVAGGPLQDLLTPVHAHVIVEITVEERIDVVLHELDWRLDELEDKVILDAGCGNGTLSAGLAERGATVVALDLSESVLQADSRLAHPRLHFVQGDLFFPPLRQQVFDAIYSCGVFHHTPDTRRCFDALVRTLKRNTVPFSRGVGILPAMNIYMLCLGLMIATTYRQAGRLPHQN
jgi:2-polyprenyl-3-methyl-5-hydroxy-6-metoxy-1,4-benzoquinol methylase